MKSFRRNSKLALASTYGCALSTFWIANDLQAEIQDISWGGGNNQATVVYGGGVDLDQVAGSGDIFVESYINFFSSTFPCTTKYGSYGTCTNVISSKLRLMFAQNIAGFKPAVLNTGDVVSPENFGESDAFHFVPYFSGTSFVAFKTLDGNVGWFRLEFEPIVGAVRFIGGQIATNGEAVVVGVDLPSPTDFFLSVADLDAGAVNDSTATAKFSEGGSGSMFIYYDSSMSELDTGAFLDIETSNTGVLEFTNATTFDFDISVNNTPFSVRWGDAFGETGTVSPNFIENLGAFTVLSGTGIRNQNTGPVFFDEGYDPSADAFLFGKVDFNVVGSAGDSVDILVSEGSLGIVHDGMPVNASFGMATIMVSDFLLGDVNCDGIVSLLDVEPFVELLTTGKYSEKADFNFDDAITLLDIQGFVNALNST